MFPRDILSFYARFMYIYAVISVYLCIKAFGVGCVCVGLYIYILIFPPPFGGSGAIVRVCVCVHGSSSILSPFFLPLSSARGWGWAWVRAWCVHVTKEATPIAIATPVNISRMFPTLYTSCARGWCPYNWWWIVCFLLAFVRRRSENSKLSGKQNVEILPVYRINVSTYIKVQGVMFPAGCLLLCS